MVNPAAFEIGSRESKKLDALSAACRNEHVENRKDAGYCGYPASAVYLEARLKKLPGLRGVSLRKSDVKASIYLCKAFDADECGGTLG